MKIERKVVFTEEETKVVEKVAKLLEEDEDEKEYEEEMKHAPAVVHRHSDGTMG